MISRLHLQPVYLIFLLGLVVRFFFLLFGAEIYFGRPDFYFDADTDSYFRPIRYLIEHGTFSGDLNHEYGPFLRTPGYPFFIGIFYLLAAKDFILTYQLTTCAQLIFDAFSVIIIYKIGEKIFDNGKTAAILAILYALYPFVIVWNVVVHSDSICIFFLLVSMLFFVSKNLKYNYYLSGIFLAISLLMRPQIGLLLPCLIIALVVANCANIRTLFLPNKKVLKSILQLLMGFLLLYSAWPIRNYVNYNKIMFFHDTQYSVGKEHDADFRAFWDYIFALKAEWEPQFSNIIHNKDVTFPDDAYVVEGDSAKLAHAIYLSQNCGSGFSWWKGYWKDKITGTNCNDEIVKLFNELRDNQIKYNKLNYYIWVPLQNLKKAIFKTKLYDQQSLARKTASYMFLYRTFLILMGLGGAYLINKHTILTSNDHTRELMIAIVAFTVTWYIYMSFIHRNIEIRYFLPTDVLLLIPASYLLSFIHSLFREKYYGVTTT